MTKESCDLTTINDTQQRWRTDTPATVPPPLPSHCCDDKDQIQHFGAPPVVQTHEDPSHSINAFLKHAGDEHLMIGRKHGTRDSASWLTSVVAHGLLIALLALFLAPADLAGLDVQLLRFSFSDADQSEQDEGLAFTELEVEPPAEEPVIPQDDSPPAEVTPDSKVATTDLAELGKSLHRDAAMGGSAGAPGSFFGIAPNGHDFVYILDMSGSMRGRRFDRATAELVRSVEGLRQNQKFYVVLFNAGTVQMFGQSSVRPTTIPATGENKAKLASWLRSAFRGGSTDPRGAIRLALRMNPSSIFILSDGKFDDQKPAKSNILRGDSDAFAIVAAAAGKVPINAIAFEDPASCHNMQRLAEMTDGEYRFAKKEGIVEAKKALALAQQAIASGDRAKSVVLLREVIAVHGHTEPGWQARKKLAPILAEVATRAMQAGEIEIAKDALTNIVQIDEHADFSAEIQDVLVAEFIELAQQSSGAEQAGTQAKLDGIVDRFPASKSAQQIANYLADIRLKEAFQLDASGDRMKSLQAMESIIKKYPGAAAAKKCAKAHSAIVDSLIERSEQNPAVAGDVADARRLRKLASEFPGTKVELSARSALKELAITMTARARDASFNREWKLRDETNQQIQAAFAGDPVLNELQQNTSKNELKARDLLRRAARLESLAKVNEARSLYETILQDYSGTLSAKKAAARFNYLRRDIAGNDKELAELILMMEK